MNCSVYVFMSVLMYISGHASAYLLEVVEFSAVYTYFALG